MLAKLVFKLKLECKLNLIQEFSVELHPNSCFIIPLSTNRYYTHETRASTAPFNMTVDKTQVNRPVRIGYVIRCSDTFIVHENGGAAYYLEKMPLKQATEPEELDAIRELYLVENNSCKQPDYTNVFNLTMNAGDLLMPTKPNEAD